MTTHETYANYTRVRKGVAQKPPRFRLSGHLLGLTCHASSQTDESCRSSICLEDPEPSASL